MSSETILLSDVGGTNVRFALYRYGQMSEIINYECKSGKTYKDYVEQFWNAIQKKEQGWERPKCAIVGAAGLIEDGVVYSKNCPIAINQESIKAWGFDEVIIENDFVTQSRAIKSSSPNDFVWNRAGENSLNGTVMVVGPGTGLGMSVIQESSKKRMLPRAAEAGFTSLPLLENAPKKQNETIEILREYMKRAHKSRLVYDQIVSGTGITRLYYARKHLEDLKKNPDLQFNMPKELSDIEAKLPLSEKQEKGMRLSAREICEMAQNGDKIAVESMNYFFKYLGRFTGDQANVNLPDRIVFAGGVMCDSYIQQKMFEPRSVFMREYKFARLKGGKRERAMGISKNRAVAFNGLVVAAKEKLRKRRDEILLKMSAMNFSIPEQFSVRLVDKKVQTPQETTTLNDMYGNTLNVPLGVVSKRVKTSFSFLGNSNSFSKGDRS